jgi:hypothetical protein
VAGRSRYDYINHDLPGEEILAVLGELPKRWGRMDRISRLAVVEVGRVLVESGLRGAGEKSHHDHKRGGLIGMTRRGCLATDLAFAATLLKGVAMASPILFGYTLPNIALAEAAGHFGLTGPVYSVYSDNPDAGGEDEVRRWLDHDPSLDFMVVGGLDVYPVSVDERTMGANESLSPGQEVVSANFRIVS